LFSFLTCAGDSAMSAEGAMSRVWWWGWWSEGEKNQGGRKRGLKKRQGFFKWAAPIDKRTKRWDPLPLRDTTVRHLLESHSGKEQRGSQMCW